MTRFCPKCGKLTEKFYDNLCKECFLESVSFLHFLPQKLELKRCRSCGSYFFKKKKFANLDSAVRESIFHHLRKCREVEEFVYRIMGNNVSVRLISKVRGLKKVEEKTIPIKLKPITCRPCQLKKCGYYEVLIQFRSYSVSFDEVLRLVEREMRKLSRKDELAFVSNVVRNKFLDVYIASTQAGLKVAKVLKEKYGAKMKLSKKLVGVRKGKRVFKTTVCLLV